MIPPTSENTLRSDGWITRPSAVQKDGQGIPAALRAEYAAVVSLTKVTQQKTRTCVPTPPSAECYQFRPLRPKRYK